LAEPASGIYRPERATFYRLFERHFDRYVWSYDERFEPHSGPSTRSSHPPSRAPSPAGGSSEGSHVSAALPTRASISSRSPARRETSALLARQGGRRFSARSSSIVTDGAFTPEGQLLPLDDVTPKIVKEVFRRPALTRLHTAEQLE
jgi:hypothetical protein